MTSCHLPKASTSRLGPPSLTSLKIHGWHALITTEVDRSSKVRLGYTWTTTTVHSLVPRRFVTHLTTYVLQCKHKFLLGGSGQNVTAWEERAHWCTWLKCKKLTNACCRFMLYNRAQDTSCWENWTQQSCGHHRDTWLAFELWFNNRVNRARVSMWPAGALMKTVEHLSVS